MIGTELVWQKIRSYGKALIITTLTQSLGTFTLVTLVFGLVFHFSGIPVYLAFIFGGIALATAPAPALSLVNEFKTKGSVTKTLIPMAALDDIVGVAVFFTVISIVARHISGDAMKIYMIPVMIFLLLVIGVVILNLGAPLDYRAIFGAGLYTFIYIAVRAAGKYFGARLGAKATGLDKNVQKYLGLTLLPHSGVSLVFTGIAVSTLSGSSDECTRIIRGTIAAAAVINEIIAVIAAKKGFELAGEMRELCRR